MPSISSPLTDAEELPEGSSGRRGAPTIRSSRAGTRKRRKANRDSMIDGLPSVESLKPVLSFLAFPALLVMAITVTGGNWPTFILYPIALLMGAYVAFSTFKGVELVLAVLLLYLPFSPVYVIPIAPGLNGTNALIALGLFATFARARNTGESWIGWPPGTTMVLLFAFITTLSGVTILFQTNGWSYLIHDQFDTYKGWIDQFIVYIIALSCIRDHQTAKRVFFYMCIGSVIVVIYALPEMYEKMGRSTIEKSRIVGPLKQSNDFGGFVAYTLMFTGAVFLAYFHNIKAWLLTPYFLVALKVLISTFSRGAYLAMALGGFLAAYYKGKGFVIFWVTLALCGVLLFPQLLPESVMARMNGLFESSDSTSAPVQLDKSSEHRLILWKAAGDMILESPIQGKGFKGFAKLKGQYTERPVHESDPHNYYLYVAAQMGVPALTVFILILLFSFHSGRVLSRHKTDRFIRAIGIGGAAATATYAGICMFGSRAVNPEFTGYFWVLLVCMQVLRVDDRESVTDTAPSKRAGLRLAKADRLGKQGHRDRFATGGAESVADDQVEAGQLAVAKPVADTVSTGRRQSRKNGRRRTNAFAEKANLQKQRPQR